MLYICLFYKEKTFLNIKRGSFLFALVILVGWEVYKKERVVIVAGTHKTFNGPTILTKKASAVWVVVPAVDAGYYDATSEDEGALLIVAADASTGEVLLATVQASYRGSKIVAAGDYVTLVEEPTEAVAAVASDAKGLLAEDVVVGDNTSLAVVVRGTVYERRITDVTVTAAQKAAMPNIIFSQSF